MNGLFASLYLDEDVDVLIAAALRSRGFSATTTLEAGQTGNSDEEQLAFAAERRMAVLTHNRIHFEELARGYYAAGRKHHGIIIAVRRLPNDVANRLLVLLNDLSAEEFEDRVVYI
jgi:predicted nuclease of predicted toxin-antitoxin system